MTLVYVDERFREIIISTINKTRVGLDFVTIQNRILKLDVWLLRKVFVVGGGWVMAYQNRVTPGPFDF